MLQSTPRWHELTSYDKAAISARNASRTPIRRPHRHCLVISLSSLSAMFSQLPCFGVQDLIRRTNFLARVASDAVQEAPLMSVCRLSSTRVTFSRSAYRRSFNVATSRAQSVFVQRSRALASRQPPNGPQSTNTVAPPARSSSYVHAVRLLRRRRRGLSGLPDQLHRLLVHADHPALRMVGAPLGL